MLPIIHDALFLMTANFFIFVMTDIFDLLFSLASTWYLSKGISKLIVILCVRHAKMIIKYIFLVKFLNKISFLKYILENICFWQNNIAFNVCDHHGLHVIEDAYV